MSNIQTHVHTHKQIYQHMYIRTNKYTNTCTYAQTNIQTHVHTHKILTQVTCSFLIAGFLLYTAICTPVMVSFFWYDIFSQQPCTSLRNSCSKNAHFSNTCSMYATPHTSVLLHIWVTHSTWSESLIYGVKSLMCGISHVDIYRVTHSTYEWLTARMTWLSHLTYSTCKTQHMSDILHIWVAFST